jgi:hypothetical protein
MVSFSMRAPLTLAAAALCLFVFGASAAQPDTGLQNVNLACSDGTNLGLPLTAADLTSLTGAVTAMSLYPAGLTCGVSPQADPPPGGNSKSDYVVGGGNQDAFPATAPCKINFGLSAHTPSGDPTQAKGTFNETVPGPCSAGPGGGDLSIDIDCLNVLANHADMHGKVEKATGFFSNFTVGSYAYISADDNGGAPFDMLGATPTSNSKGCGTAAEQENSHGRINVHDADLTP